MPVKQNQETTESRWCKKKLNKASEVKLQGSQVKIPHTKKKRKKNRVKPLFVGGSFLSLGEMIMGLYTPPEN